MAIDIAVAVGDPASVECASYDRAWPERFRLAALPVREALGRGAARVRHVGATAVPGLPGRAQLDLQLGVAQPEAEEEYRPALEALGFTLQVREADHRILAAAAGALGLPGDFTVRLFVCRAGGVLEYDQLLLVQYFTHEVAERRLYAEFKRRLARQHRDDPETYERRKQLYLREAARLARLDRVGPLS